jgi:hypothetical protein
VRVADTLVVTGLFSLSGVLAAGLLGLSWMTVSRLGSRMDRLEDRQLSFEQRLHSLERGQNSIQQGQRSFRSEMLERLDLIAERVSRLERAG